jgi:hypothetical protein
VVVVSVAANQGIERKKKKGKKARERESKVRFGFIAFVNISLLSIDSVEGRRTSLVLSFYHLIHSINFYLYQIRPSSNDS